MKKPLLSLLFVVIYVPILSIPWTFLFYFAADNGLYQNALQDINELEKGVRDSMHVLAFIDHGFPNEEKNTQILKIIPDDSDQIISPIVKNYEETDSGNWHTLAEFVNYGLKNYPADKTVLVIWSHGTGWYKGENSKYICPDNTSEQAISVYDGDLKKAFQSFNKKLTLTIMDACLMGSVEVMTEIYPFTSYFIASEKEVPVTGFPWDQILMKWNYQMDDETNYKMINSEYIQSYSIGGSQNPLGEMNIQATISLAKTSEFEQFAERLKEFCLLYAPICFNDAELAQKITNIRNTCINYNDLQADVDILDLFSKLSSSNDLPPDLLDKCLEIKTLAEQLLINNRSLNLNSLGSMSIFFPIDITMLQYLFNLKYHNLTFSDFSFPFFANSLIRPDDFAPFPVQDIQFEIHLNTLYLSWQKVYDPSPVYYTLRYYNQGILRDTLTTNLTTASFLIANSGRIEIVCTDYAGNKSEASMINFNYEEPSSEMAYICPNPVKQSQEGKLKLFLKEDRYNLTCKIYKISGNLVGQKKIPYLKAGENTLLLSEILGLQSKMSSGIYIAVIHNSSLKFTIKFAFID